ncbi:MAG: tetratricopeptide repeat protein [Magnetococcales bacterium]|nr:tetratricopeptide repeat protein [Magnetococcales bacterium]
MKPEKDEQLTDQDKFALAYKLYESGNLQESCTLLSKLSRLYPNNVELLTFVGKIAFELKDYSLAIDHLSKAIIIDPKNAMTLFVLGNTLLAKGNYRAAKINLYKAVEVDPKLNIAWYALANAYIFEKKNDEALPILLDVVRRDNKHFKAHFQISSILKEKNRFMMAKIFLDLYHHNYSGPPLKDVENTICDTLFIDKNVAYNTAKKKNIIQVTAAINVPQICYYLGEKIYNDNKYLIAIPENEIGEFFCFSRLRRPKEINFNPDKSEEINQAIEIAKTLQDNSSLFVQLMEKNIQLSRTQKPEFSSNKKLKILLLANRNTTVIQYSSRYLSDALKRKGCDVSFVIENSDLETIETRHYYEEVSKIVPNAIININHLYNENIHEDTYNITWWQDLMPEIANNKSLKWRNRDLAISAYTTFDSPLYNSGAKQVYRQDHCIDQNIFFSSTPLTQRKKIVFVGSSYINQIQIFGEQGQQLIALMQEKMMLGQDISDSFLNELSKKFAISFDDIFYNLLPFVVRDTSIEWLCSMADSLDFEVEIYGRWWDTNPIVAPFFKGELPHGPKVANVYNEAKYAIAAMHRTVNSQRVAEIAACGCIPVLLDERSYPQVEKPHWDDECLFFRTKNELKKCFSNTPKNDPQIIAKNYTYDSFAEKIITYISTGKYPDEPIKNKAD